MRKSYFLFITVFLFFGIYFTYFIMKYPYIGLEVAQDDNKQIIVTKVLENGVAEFIGIKKGDRILSINGQSPDKFPSIKKYNLVEKVTKLEINREGIKYFYFIQANNYKNQLFFHLIFPLLFFVLSIVGSLFLMKQQKDKKEINTLIVLLQLYGISPLVGAASARTEPVAQFFSISCLLLIPILLLHFFFLFFQKYDIEFIRFKWIKKLYFVVSLVLLLELLFLIAPLSNHLYWVTKILTLLTFINNVGNCMFFIVKNYLNYKNTIYNSLFKIIIVALLISYMPFILFYALPSIIFKQELFSGEVTYLFTYFLPLTFVYLVSTNQVLDIHFYVKRIYYYASLAFIPTVLLTIFSFVLKDEGSMIKWLQYFILIYFTIFLAFYIKEELDYRIRNKLFSEKYNYQSSIYQLVTFLSKEKSKKAIESYVVNEIKTMLDLKHVAFIEFNKEQNNIHFVCGDCWDFEKNILLDHLSSDFQRQSFGEIRKLNKNSYLIVAESTTKTLVVVLGRKKNFTAFNLEEIEWLKTISYYMNVSYQNLQTIEELINELEKIRTEENAPSWILKMLFQIEEKERKRLSTDLHDSALQDQIILYQKISNLLENNNLTPQLKEELTFISEGLLDVIHDIRETCNELMPPFLKETGVIASLNNLIRKVQLRTNIVVDFNVDQQVKSTEINDEISLTLYRIVQELLNNAEKHAKASNVSISIMNEKNQLLLKYKDNGQGFSEKKLPINNGHIGIYGIKERVKSVEGSFSFHTSKENDGLSLSIQIPIPSFS